MLQDINSFNNIKLKLAEAAGAAVSAEVLMRLIAERYKSVQDELKLIIKAEKYQPRNTDYWDCKLEFLDKAIEKVFSNKLETSELAILKEFRPLRNDLLHGKFVDLMMGLHILPTSRTIMPLSEKKDILSGSSISEAIKSIDRNGGLERVRILANIVISILEELVK